MTLLGVQDFDGTPGQKGKADEKTRVNEHEPT